MKCGTFPNRFTCLGCGQLKMHSKSKKNSSTKLTPTDLQSFKKPADNPGHPWCKLLPLLLLCTLFLCQCYVWKAHKSLQEVRQEIKADEQVPMEEYAQYHLGTAKNLLIAAEKQYEDADFTEAIDLTEQAQDQLDRSRRLREFHKLVSPDRSGGQH